MSTRVALVSLAAAALIWCGACGDSGSESGSVSTTTGATTPAAPAPVRERPHARPESNPNGYSAGAVERAIRANRSGGARPRMVVCRPEGGVERRLVTDFGRTRAPIFRCDMDLGDVPYSMHVQVLRNGCFVANAIASEQGLRGCGVRRG